MTLKDELFQRLADRLSEDIYWEMTDRGENPQSLVDRLLPKGSPGAQFHRPLLLRRLEELKFEGTSLDLVTCLQLCETHGWAIGLLDEDDE